MTIQQQIPEIPTKAPKSVEIQYYVATLNPASSEYRVCLLCKNYTEAKKIYKEQIEEADVSELISIIMCINRISEKEIRKSEIVVARTIKVK